jgi:hypothetical protein
MSFRRSDDAFASSRVARRCNQGWVVGGPHNAVFVVWESMLQTPRGWPPHRLERSSGGIPRSQRRRFRLYRAHPSKNAKGGAASLFRCSRCRKPQASRNSQKQKRPQRLRPFRWFAPCQGHSYDRAVRILNQDFFRVEPCPTPNNLRKSRKGQP